MSNTINLLDYLDKRVYQLLSIGLINNYCPASLRIEARKLDLFKLGLYLNTNTLYREKMNILKKGSRFSNAIDWLDFVFMVFDDAKTSIDILRKSNIIKYFEDDDYFIYRPLDFTTYKIANYKNWCTMVKSTFYSYLKKDLIIYLKKDDISNSYISQLVYSNVVLHNYTNNTVGLFEDKKKFIRSEYYTLDMSNFQKYIEIIPTFY